MHTILTLLPVFYQTFTIYLFLVIALRVFGSGRLGQLTVFDLVMVLLLGTCVETSMVAFNNHLDAGLVSAGTLLLANRMVGLLVENSNFVRRLLCPEPMLLVADGVFLTDHARRAGITEAQVMQAVREREISSMGDVKFAVLESDGEINVVSRHSALKYVSRTGKQPPAETS